MRKGKWKPLTCKILRGAISTDGEHHNTSLLGELSPLAEDKKGHGKKSSAGYHDGIERPWCIAGSGSVEA